MQKQTKSQFSEVIEIMYNYKHPTTGQRSPLVSDQVYNIVQKNAEAIDNYIVHERDFNFEYFGFKTLEKSYLMQADGAVVERPQFMFMRVSLGIHGEDLEVRILMDFEGLQPYTVYVLPDIEWF